MTMWQKLMHKLFGWHYAVIYYGGDFGSYKVIASPSGKVFAVSYGRLIPLSKGNYEPLTWSEVGHD